MKSVVRSPLKERIFWPVLTAALAAVLVILGGLQYRWSKEVSDATSTRLRASLISSMLAFRQDFARELSNVTAAFQAGGDGRTSTAQQEKEKVEQFRQWKKTGSHSGIVKAVYLAQDVPGQQMPLLRLNQAGSAFEATTWPTELSNLPNSLPRISIHKPGFPPSLHREGQKGSATTAWVGPDVRMFFTGGRDEHREVGVIAAQQAPGEPGGPGRGEFFGVQHLEHHGANGAEVTRAFPKSPWFIDASVPALISPIDPFFAQSPEDSPRWVIVELDQDFLRRHVFPELTARYFPSTDGLGYDVAVVNDADGMRDFYASSRPVSQKDADARLDLVGPSGRPRFLDSAMPQFQNGQHNVAATDHVFEPGGVAISHEFHSGAPPLLPASMWTGTGNWLLLVKNRQGSLEAAVSGLRQRQLALSFGILLVLAGTMAMVVLASRRAHNLAKLQMDFVAGVSHELRTPLAVISSAAENIADGLVENKQQLSRYGKVIKNQSAQLKQLVEQILLFAATRHRGQHYNLRPTDPASVIDIALENTAEVIHNEEIAVEKKIEANLPPVLVDCQSLAQCLQNLIMNAVKYGGDARWIGITAAAQQISRGTEVSITISDHGIGIAADELKQVFDPFYRGSAVRAAQIHGSGLGLPLAKSIIEAMGGRITVESTPGDGSSFTLHLPMAAAAATAGDAVMSAAMNPKRLVQNHE